MVIYKITNLINGKIYIGMTTQKYPNTRWIQHKSTAKRLLENGRKGQKIHEAIKEFGADNFKFETIDKSDDLKELCNLEVKYIKKYNSDNPKYGYNVETGGEEKRISALHTEEYSRKRSEITKRYFSKEENRKLVSERAIKRNKENPQLAINVSNMQKERAKNGTNPITKRGKEHPFSKDIIQLTLNGDFVSEFGSGFEAERLTGISQAHINKCCLGKSYQANGYLWIYKINNNTKYINSIVRNYENRYSYCSSKIELYKNNKLVNEFKTLKELSIFLKCNYVTLSKKLKKTNIIDDYTVIKY